MFVFIHGSQGRGEGIYRISLNLSLDVGLFVGGITAHTTRHPDNLISSSSSMCLPPIIITYHQYRPSIELTPLEPLIHSHSTGI